MILETFILRNVRKQTLFEPVLPAPPGDSLVPSAPIIEMYKIEDNRKENVSELVYLVQREHIWMNVI